MNFTEDLIQKIAELMQGRKFYNQLEGINGDDLGEVVSDMAPDFCQWEVSQILRDSKMCDGLWGMKNQMPFEDELDYGILA